MLRLPVAVLLGRMRRRHFLRTSLGLLAATATHGRAAEAATVAEAFDAEMAAFMEAQMSMGMSYFPKDTVAVTLEEAGTPGTFPEGKWTTNVCQQMEEGVDAWICASSGTAQTLCRYLLSQNIRIPQDVALTGYHASLNQLQDLPPLTTTAIADEELGAAALRRLLHRLQHPDESQRSILLPSKFQQGATTPQEK